MTLNTASARERILPNTRIRIGARQIRTRYILSSTERKRETGRGGIERRREERANEKLGRLDCAIIESSIKRRGKRTIGQLDDAPLNFPWLREKGSFIAYSKLATILCFNIKYSIYTTFIYIYMYIHIYVCIYN